MLTIWKKDKGGMLHVPKKLRALPDREWADVLKMSVHKRAIHGVKFPSFPDESVQRQFVGSANEDSLNEATEFYSVVKGYSAALGMPIDYERSRILDFGCGWGRFLRFFWRDVRPDQLHGVDIDPEILAVCRTSGISAVLDEIDPMGRLPFPDGTFTHAFAYSVFTHLPPKVSAHWLAEISRVCHRGGIFVCTTEPRRFLEHIENIPDDTDSAWAAGLKRTAGDITLAKKKFDDGEFVYIPTGGGNYRDASVYGDAVIPLSYIKDRWSKYFQHREYIDDPSRFWQAVVVSQKS